MRVLHSLLFTAGVPCPPLSENYDKLSASHGVIWFSKTAFHGHFIWILRKFPVLFCFFFEAIQRTDFCLVLFSSNPFMASEGCFFFFTEFVSVPDALRKPPLWPLHQSCAVSCLSHVALFSELSRNFRGRPRRCCWIVVCKATVNGHWHDCLLFPLCMNWQVSSWKKWVYSS